MAAVNEVTGSNLAAYAALTVAAFQGREAEAAPLIEAATSEGLRRGEAQGLTFIHWAAAVLHNGLGRYDEALAAAQRATEAPLEIRLATWGLVELIEAAARGGKPELAADALGRLSQTTAAGGTEWALGIEARSRALLSDNETAERLYREAIERLERPASVWSSPAPTCYTANGCAASVAGSTRASSYAALMSYSRSSGWRRSPSAPESSSGRPASTPVNGPSRRVTT